MAVNSQKLTAESQERQRRQLEQMRNQQQHELTRQSNNAKIQNLNNQNLSNQNLNTNGNTEGQASPYTQYSPQVNTNATGLRGVSAPTQQRVAGTQDYQQGDRVTEMQNQLQSVLDNKPQGYTSKYSDALDGILQQIQNPEKFNYSFNGDEMFKQYADLYTQLGRQASMDAMGQAAGLTGGYGNSYAQNAGNQAYNQYLLGLYDKGAELQNQAFNRWQADRADQYNQLAALQQADQTDYGRYRDEMADWQTDRGYYTDAENEAYARDYNEFVQNRDYWNQQQQLENQDWWQANQFTESIRQFDKTSDLDWAKLEEQQRQFDSSLTEEQRQYNQNIAIDYVKAILANGQMPSAELLVAAGLSKADAKKMKAELEAASGGGGGGGGGGGRSSGGDTTADDNLFTKAAKAITNNPTGAAAYGTAVTNWVNSKTGQTSTTPATVQPMGMNYLRNKKKNGG